MINNPLVSIIIPTYNSAKFLPETIESVLSQSYRNWEMLIVDDGSTDNTLSIARNFSFQDKRMRIFPLGFNYGGPAVPRNYGMKRAQGDYIAFLDSDDLWLPEKLQKQICFLESNRDIFWLYSKFIIKSDDNQGIVASTKSKSGYIFNDLLLHFNIIPILTVVMRNRKENNTYFFDEDKRLVAVEDYGMWLLLAKDEKISFIDEPLAIYRAHSRGISAGAHSNFKKCSLILKKFSRYAAKPIVIGAYFNYYRRLIFLSIVDTFLKIRSRLKNRRNPD